MITSSQQKIISSFLSKDNFILTCYRNGLCNHQEAINASMENLNEAIQGLCNGGMDAEPAIALINDAKGYTTKEEVL